MSVHDGPEYAKARSALQEKVNLDDSLKALKIKIPPLFKAIEAKHERLSKYFYSGIGLKLQYVDSQITEGILRGAIFHRIPVLPIHDSYMCAENHADDVIMLMREVFRSVTGLYPGIGATTRIGDVCLKNF